MQITMSDINWGIIGCGNVTEKKSGPAFNKIANSSLVAVMRRDAEKAADYAQRHLHSHSPGITYGLCHYCA
jgi:predicted dehydrogenase